MNQDSDEKPIMRIKRVSLFRIIWFTKLNLEIHKKDPVFTKASESAWSKFNFSITFGWKLARQSRFILLENKSAAGALSLEKRNQSIFVYAVGILPEFRRKGYATELMKFTEDFARKKKRTFVSFSVLLENEPAIKMYEKLEYRSQGVGLTLIRFLLWKVNNELSQFESKEKIRFRKMENSKEIKDKTYNWWYKEIEYSIGEEAMVLSKKDSLIDFEFKPEWAVYDILTEDISTGTLAIIPSGFFKTIVLFTDPVKTWKNKWHLNLIKELYDQNILQLTESENKQKKPNNHSVSNSSLLQIFLTNQHMIYIQNSFDEKAVIHDSAKDRQIYFKKIE